MADFGSKPVFASHLTAMYAIGVAWEMIPLCQVRMIELAGAGPSQGMPECDR
jgi:hypothetical protein